MGSHSCGHLYENGGEILVPHILRMVKNSGWWLHSRRLAAAGEGHLSGQMAIDVQ